MAATPEIAKPNTARPETAPTWQRPTRARQAAMLLVFVAVCFAAAGLGASSTATSVNGWYQTLNRPDWNPPDWVFGPVWTVLYLMMAIAAWCVWRSTSWRRSGSALGWWAVQLALNSLWSIVFFGMRRPGWAFAEIVLLWMAIAITIRGFLRHSVAAALLLLPYLLWTTFAAVLNFVVWQMN